MANYEQQAGFPAWVKLLRQWRPAEKPQLRGEIWRWPVYVETARYKRLAGYLEGAFREGSAPGAFNEPVPFPETVINSLKNLFRKNSRLREDRLLAALAPAAAALAQTPEKLARDLVAGGYLGRWVRLRPDEKSVAGVEYGPLEGLVVALEAERKDLLAENRKWAQEIRAATKELQRRYAEAVELQQNSSLAPFLPAIREILNFLQQKSEQIGQTLDDCRRGTGPAEQAGPESGEKTSAGGTVPGVTLHPLFPWVFHPWERGGKFYLGIEFLVALLDCIFRSPGGFEWKELGGGFAPGIGSSKRFDAAREDLLQLAEAVTGTPLEKLGLTSTGSLYSLYVLGRFRAFFAGAPAQEFLPTVNALTNVQVNRLTGLEIFAERVVLTENRALLLKMEATGWANAAPETLVLGLDGRLRLAHGRFLRLLAESHPHLPWFAWVDTDEAGLAIARQVAEINPACRFVLPLEGGLKTPPDLAGWLAELTQNPFLRNREQEENLGNAAVWNEIFK